MHKMSLASLLPAGIDYTELKQQENRRSSLAFLNGTLIQNSSSSSGGIMSRTFTGGVWGLASSADMSSPGMEKVIRKAVANARLLSHSVNKGKILLPSNPAVGEYLFFSKKPAWSTAQRIDFIKVIDDYVARTYPELSTRQIALNQDEMEKNILTSDGGSLHSMTPRSILVIYLMTTHNGEAIQNYDVFGGIGQSEDVFDDPSVYFPEVDRIYKELQDKKDAVFARGGTFDVVLDAKLAGILSHEAIGHTTEADFVLNGSIAGDYLNQPVASEM
ncbi:MAG TPA: DNA gyrase modulator, partial [Candidatus Cloacimonadota bacterium]|nr:DNA gyrase modulator [Candidatus Cloacimonadota bacterium]